MKNPQRVAPLAVLVILALAFVTQVHGQGVNTSSTTQSLTTSTISTTVIATQNHITQPFGKYTFDPSGTLYLANTKENVSLALSTGFPLFSSYQSNSSLFQYQSGCMTIRYYTHATNLEQFIIGNSCPLGSLKISFPSILDIPTLLNDSCTLQFKAETYSWCGDTGATFSYSNAVLTITPSSTSFTIDPTIIQSSNWQTCTTASCNVTLGSNVAVNNCIVVNIEIIRAFAAGTTTPALSVADTRSTGAFTNAVNSINQNIAGVDEAWSFTFINTVTSSGSDTITVSNGDATITKYFFDALEVGANVLCSTYVTNSGIGTSTTPATPSTSFNYAGYVAIGTFGAAGGTPSAGASFTAINSGVTTISFQDEYSTTVGSPTTFPFGLSSSNPWFETGIVIAAFSNSLLVFTVSTTSSGMILMPTINNAPTTVESLSTFTMTCCTTNTLTAIAVPWGGNIFQSWAGATVWIQDTLNPTQTATYSSFASTTLTSTITAVMTTPSGGSSNPIITPSYSPSADPAFPLVIILSAILVLILALALRRQ